MQADMRAIVMFADYDNISTLIVPWPFPERIHVFVMLREEALSIFKLLNASKDKELVYLSTPKVIIPSVCHG